MKILFIASNPYDEPSLMLEREITEIQRRLDQAVMHHSIKIKFLPDVPIEQIPSDISNFRPDILHISSHGGKNSLWLKNEAGKKIELKAEVLSALLNTDHPPELVYINACDSSPIAETLTQTVTFAIGSTAPITNRAARAAVCRFYELIFQGYPLNKAFKNSKALLDAIAEGKVTSVLHCAASLNPDAKTFIEPFRLVAKFSGSPSRRFSKSNDMYSVKLGVTGCPYDASMIVFVTDDDTYKYPAIGFTSGPPVGGIAWADPIEIWGDIRIAVIATTGDGRSYTTTSTLCEALGHFWKNGKMDTQIKANEPKFLAAVHELSDNATAISPDDD